VTTVSTPVVRTANERRRKGSIAWHVGALAVLAVVLYPVIWVLGASFKPSKDIIASIDLLPSKPVWANFSGLADGISGISIGSFFMNSLTYAGLAVAGVVISSSLTAYAFAKIRFAGRNLLFTLMIGTLLLPYHVLLIPQYVMFRKLELVDTLVPLVAGKFLATEAFFVFLMVQFMRGIPRELDEAAKIDGASSYGIFTHVILPLSRPALVTTAIFSFIWTWNDFFRQLVFLSDLEDYTVPVALTLFIDSTSQSAVGPMFAMSVLSLLPVFLFFVAFQRMLVEGINTSGLKG
jgi:multiple sugar transport system permease protein